MPRLAIVTWIGSCGCGQGEAEGGNEREKKTHDVNRLVLVRYFIFLNTWKPILMAWPSRLFIYGIQPSLETLRTNGWKSGTYAMATVHLYRTCISQYSQTEETVLDK